LRCLIQKTEQRETGLILGGIALFFFAMVFVKRIWLSEMATKSGRLR
jgi:hypothetical protein